MRKALTTAAAVLIACTGLALGTHTALAASTRWVSNTATLGTAPGTSCADPGYSSIDDAVAASSSGDTIEVCPGSYTVANDISVDDLTLVGSDPAPSGSNPPACASSMTPDTSVDTVIESSGSDGVNLDGTGITFENFWVEDNATPGPGASTSASNATGDGYTIFNDVFYNNLFGLYFNSPGSTPSTVEQSCFASNNQSGPASGDGIYEDQGLVDSAISNNAFTNNDSAGIVLISETDVTIDDNTSSGDAGFISVILGTGGTVSGNTATDDEFGNVYLCEDNGTDVDHNTTTGGTATGAAGVYVDGSTDSCATSTDLDINHDQTTDSQYGFYADTDALSGSTVEDEQATDSVVDGIYSQAGSNTFEGNVASGSGTYDCQDTTSGTGTSGTDNTWTDDQGTTSSPTGICAAGPPPNIPDFPSAPLAMALAGLMVGSASVVRRRQLR